MIEGPCDTPSPPSSSPCVSIETIGELGGERPPGHGRAGARLVFEVELRSTQFSLQARLTGVAVGLGAPRLPRRGFETLRVSVIKEQEVLFDATYHDRDEAVRGLAGRVVEVGSLGTVLLAEELQTPRVEVARLRVELTGVRTTDEFSLRYAVAADRVFVIVRPVLPGPLPSCSGSPASARRAPSPEMGDERAHAHHVVPRLEAAAQAAGRPTQRVIAGLPIAVCDDAAEGRAAAERRYGLYQQITTYARMRARGDARSPGEVAVVGSEAEVRARLRSYASAGVTDLLAMVFEVGSDAASRASSRRRSEGLLAALAS